MKTKLELDTLIYEYLELIAKGYRTGDFAQLFSLLAEDCVFESQWVLTPNTGREAVVSYLTGKGETLKKTGCFPSAYVYELIGNINTVKNVNININGENRFGSVGLHYPTGELCLLMSQTIDDKENETILRIKLNANEEISRIDLCMPELFKYRHFYTFVSICPSIGNEVIDGARIRVSEDYYGELYLFFDLADESFDEYDDLHVPIAKWIKILEYWKRFYSFETFDEAFEDACGINYENFTANRISAKQQLGRNGDYIWGNRSNNSAMLKGLIEWTNKYKDVCDYINLYGF